MQLIEWHSYLWLQLLNKTKDEWREEYPSNECDDVFERCEQFVELKKKWWLSYSQQVPNLAASGLCKNVNDRRQLLVILHFLQIPFVNASYTVDTRKKWITSANSNFVGIMNCSSQYAKPILEFVRQGGVLNIKFLNKDKMRGIRREDVCFQFPNVF